mmetsp:Transcript_2866/g.3224  ORF Transcript_2866/g.3224 Transcript_2866/m.3224 type:complete len:124 (+) Transcript_2866:109-480(+)|eukprot:CAMPEP_0197862498 /NCGR_PEP_ID=MMETSP1438-20131217/39317_1 /TAXON_ID=1461541 /ORGANISM="Pterosperma sp., Strain CCMP1384" /LENGTH=123 /DNA_ID=CAMNT_0043480079 /DNA_START=103 /DNA_END=474 /DNA_ORIENTATION=-
MSSKDEEASSSTAAATSSGDVDVEFSDQPFDSDSNSMCSRIWRRLVDWWEVIDEHLADLFGLNESKYQWAVDEVYYQQREEEKKARMREEAKERAAEQRMLHEGEELQAMEAQETPSEPAVTS